MPGSRTPSNAKPRAQHDSNSVWLARVGYGAIAMSLLLPLFDRIAHSDPEFHPHSKLETLPAFNVWFPLGGVLFVFFAAHVGQWLFGDRHSHRNEDNES